MDEIQWQRGHHYLTLVYQIEDGMKRLLWVAEERTEREPAGFLRDALGGGPPAIRFVCSDMWQAYLNVIAEQLAEAVHVLDRFHIMKKMSEAIDEVRRGEARTAGDRTATSRCLKHSRWCLLKRPENLTDKQTVKLARVAPVQSSERAELPDAGRLSTLLGIHQPDLGGEVPRPMVYTGHAEPDRADEESCSQFAGASAT